MKLQWTKQRRQVPREGKPIQYASSFMIFLDYLKFEFVLQIKINRL